MYFDEVLKKVSEPSDVAIFFISFSVGFALNVLYFGERVPDGTAASVLAVGCLGMKKALGLSVLGSEHVTKKLAKKKANTLRKYFKNSQGASDISSEAFESLNQLEKMLDADLIKTSQFHQLIDEQIQNYVAVELKKAGPLFTDYKQRYEDLRGDFKNLQYSQLQSPQEYSEEEVQKLCTSLEEIDNKYFPENREIGLKIRRRRARPF